MKFHKSLTIGFLLNLNINITVSLYRDFVVAGPEKITWLGGSEVEEMGDFIENMNC